MPFYPFLGEGSPTKMDYRKKGTLILTSLQEDLARVCLKMGTRSPHNGWCPCSFPFKTSLERVPHVASNNETPTEGLSFSSETAAYQSGRRLFISSHLGIWGLSRDATPRLVG